MSEELARRRLIERLQMANAEKLDGYGISGGTGTTNGAKKNKWIQYVKKHGFDPEGYRKMMKKAGKKVGKSAKKTVKSKAKSKAKAKTSKRTCFCKKLVKIKKGAQKGKKSDRCLFYDKKKCSNFDDLDKKERNKYLKEHGFVASGLVGGCDNCSDENSMSGLGLVGDLDYMSDSD